jgi:hypothetical protein
MKKAIKKIQLKKQTISLLNNTTAQQLNAGKPAMLTRIVDSCKKYCPTILEPECTGR